MLFNSTLTCLDSLTQPPHPENLFYALLKLQDKTDTMTIAGRPSQVRLEPDMVEDFKRNVAISQVAKPK